ncbi:dynactin subunit [Cyclospora cayetanensis]|uniref:Dynactin subunit 4 n=1 Tax=Cyclospora cayetanensis TaxID=88456 RepID=A0A1D3CTU8_9EIME|nr:dynactin subunit [Cyclospora cayetanensis]
MLPTPSGISGMPFGSGGLPSSIPLTNGHTTASSSCDFRCGSRPPACTRLTVGGFSDSGLITLLTSDRQSFSIPSSLIPDTLEVGSVVTLSIRRNSSEEAARRSAILQSLLDPRVASEQQKLCDSEAADTPATSQATTSAPGCLFMLEDLYLCEPCGKVLSPLDVFDEVECHICPGCLDVLPPGEASACGLRCGKCFTCPRCLHTLSLARRRKDEEGRGHLGDAGEVTEQLEEAGCFASFVAPQRCDSLLSVPSLDGDAADDAEGATAGGEDPIPAPARAAYCSRAHLYFYSCAHCSWTSEAADIASSIPAVLPLLASQHQREGLGVIVFEELMEVLQHNAFEKERRRQLQQTVKSHAVAALIAAAANPHSREPAALPRVRAEDAKEAAAEDASATYSLSAAEDMRRYPAYTEPLHAEQLLIDTGHPDITPVYSTSRVFTAARCLRMHDRVGLQELLQAPEAFAAAAAGSSFLPLKRRLLLPRCTKRCCDCERIIVKPQLSPEAVPPFRINHSAALLLPSIDCRVVGDVGHLLQGEKGVVLLALTSCADSPVTVTLISATKGYMQRGKQLPQKQQLQGGETEGQAGKRDAWWNLDWNGSLTVELGAYDELLDELGGAQGEASEKPPDGLDEALTGTGDAVLAQWGNSALLRLELTGTRTEMGDLTNQWGRLWCATFMYMLPALYGGLMLWVGFNVSATSTTGRLFVFCCIIFGVACCSTAAAGLFGVWGRNEPAIRATMVVFIVENILALQVAIILSVHMLRAYWGTPQSCTARPPVHAPDPSSFHASRPDSPEAILGGSESHEITKLGVHDLVFLLHCPPWHEAAVDVICVVLLLSCIITTCYVGVLSDLQSNLDAELLLEDSQVLKKDFDDPHITKPFLPPPEPISTPSVSSSSSREELSAKPCVTPSAETFSAGSEHLDPPPGSNSNV